MITHTQLCSPKETIEGRLWVFPKKSVDAFMGKEIELNSKLCRENALKYLFTHLGIDVDLVQTSEKL
ncbi:hypothetical protein N836_17600 [Leptolyngbya sp. Heron Island J]|nr:hypothetical protein N836_17600 [Leptolyngbya sp. Heron Island J]